MKQLGLIKYAVLAAALVLFAAGCSEKEEDDGDDGLSDGEQAIERLLAGSNPNGAQIKTAHGLSTTVKGENTFIGYGIKAFGGPTFAEALGPQLLKNEVYADTTACDGNSCISSSYLGQSESYTVIREHLGDVYTGRNFNADVNIPWISGAVNKQYGGKQTLHSESKYYSYIYSWVTNKHTIDGLLTFGEFLRDKLDSLTVTALNDPNTAPNTVFEKLGTHIILSASIGGEANISGLYNSITSASEDDMKTALDFKSYTGSKTLTDEQKRIASQTVLTVNSWGGDPLAGITLENLGTKLEQWAPTITGKETIANIYSLMPIWEVAKDSNRKAALQKYFNDSVNTQNSYLSNYFTKEGLLVNSGTYEIECWMSLGKYIIADNNSTAEGTKLVVWEKQNTSAAINGRRWVAVASSTHSGYFSLRNVNSGKMMDAEEVCSDWIHCDWNVMQNSANGSDSQLFSPVKNDDGSVTLLSMANNLGAVAVYGDGANGDHITFFLPSADNYVKWILHRVD